MFHLVELNLYPFNYQHWVRSVIPNESQLSPPSHSLSVQDAAGAAEWNSEVNHWHFVDHRYSVEVG